MFLSVPYVPYSNPTFVSRPSVFDKIQINLGWRARVLITLNKKQISVASILYCLSKFIQQTSVYLADQMEKKKKRKIKTKKEGTKNASLYSSKKASQHSKIMWSYKDVARIES